MPTTPRSSPERLQRNLTRNALRHEASTGATTATVRSKSADALPRMNPSPVCLSMLLRIAESEPLREFGLFNGVNVSRRNREQFCSRLAD